MNNKEEIDINESESDNNGCDEQESSNEGIDKTEQEWYSAVAEIKHFIMKISDLKADDWIVVAFPFWEHGILSSL